MKPDITLTAELAFDRYKAFFDADALIQNGWHESKDGRQLACGLGALDPEINKPSDCPASVMPRWLAQMVPWLFDGMDFADAKDWGLKFYTELKRLQGVVPFSVVHDWQANVVAPLGLEWRTLMGVSTEAQTALQALHVRAMAGDVAPRTAWFDALQPNLRQSYAYAYAYANANANANADAYAYAYANANANANAYADAYAYAYAYANANAYAYAYTYAYAYADANAKKIRLAEAIKRLGYGLVECLARLKAA
jgi:hypothetical protein